MHRLSCSVMFGLALAGLSAHSHHSIIGMYDRTQLTTVAGVIIEFHFVQPHAFLLLDADVGNTESQRWYIEMDNRRELAELGVTRDTFQPGNEVTVIGDQARDGKERLYLRQLDRSADGLRLGVDATGFHPSISTVP